jgi:hypothetical protein
MVAKKPAKIPRIEFRYSWVYDQENRLRYTDPLYPSGDRIREYREKVSDDWKPMQRKILGAVSRISSLPWREDVIVCYLVGRGIPMSDPLTMPLYEDQTDIFIEKMVYQLVERVVLHPMNLKTRSEFWESMFRSLSEDGVKVSYMVPVNAVFQEIISRYLRPGDSGQESLVTRNLDYRRAWEIVNNIGHSDIIERFRRGQWD